MSKEDLRYEYECMLAQCELFAKEDEIMLGVYIDETIDELSIEEVNQIIEYLEEDKHNEGYDTDLIDSMIKYIEISIEEAPSF